MKKVKKLVATLLAVVLAGSVPTYDALRTEASVLVGANTEDTCLHDQNTYEVYDVHDHEDCDHEDCDHGCEECEGYAGEGIKIALLDAGVSEFETKKSVSFVDEENNGSAHGNSMAAVLMSQVPEADIYDVKVLDDEGHGTYASVVAGINWAIDNKVDIISMSFVGTERSALLDDALTRAYEAGIFVVAAAGNYSSSEKVYPAAYPTVLAVGAVDEIGQTSYSNYGDYVDTYVLWNDGTSGAAQTIAGTAAYILGTEPGLTVDQLFARFSTNTYEKLDKFDLDNADTMVYACDSCYNHYWGSWKVTKEPTCYTTGTRERKCSRCGKIERETIAKKSHVTKNVTDVDSTCTATGRGHAVCTLCGTTVTGYQIAAKGHNWSGWSTTKSATCTADGSKQRTCSRCGSKETQTISKTGHNWSSWSTTKSATCTADGTKQRTCSRCNGKETQTISKYGHNWGNWTTTKAATCTVDGSMQRVCSRCSGKETQTITKTGHSYGSWTTTKAATCTTDGTKQRVCSRCNNIETATIKCPGGHKWDSWKVTTANTCGKDGVETRVCLTCNQKETRVLAKTGLHTPHGNYKITKEATCTTAGSKYLVCDTCGANCGTTSIPALGHNYGSWTTTKAATCTATGTKQRTCSRCSAKETVTINALGHNWGNWTTTKAATCTVDGSKQRVCSRCSQKETQTITKTGHSYGSWTTTKAATCTTDGSKQRVCSKCNNIETATIKNLGGHKWDSWKVTTANTCGKDGVETRVCLTCNQKETRVLAKTGLHTPHGNYKITKEATCTTAGSKYLMCDTCGANCGNETIPALGHNYGSWTTTKAATCTATGTKQRTCSRCSAKETATIDALGHSYGSWTTTKAATCTTDGTKQRVCSRCSNKETATIKSPGGHKWDSWKVTTANTCGKDGVETRVCLACQQKETRVLPKTGLHTPHGNYKITKEATCTTAGSKYLMCDTCGANCGNETIPALGHNWGSWTTTKAATCTTTGTKQRVCSRCSTKETATIDAFGHSYGNWTTTKTATCTTDGSKQRVCSRCSNKETATIKSPGGHKWDSWIVTTANTCGKDGVETRVCLACQQKETRVMPKTGLHTPHGNYKITKAATCTTDGSKYLVCDTCGANCGNETIPALGHKMGDWVTVKAKTCTTDGSEKRQCERCTYSETRTIKSPGGHIWESWRVVTPVTCETDGLEARNCLNCGLRETRVITHTGHVPGDWEIVEEPDGDEPGKKVIKCQKCDEELDSKLIIEIKLYPSHFEAILGINLYDTIQRDYGSEFGSLPTFSSEGYVFNGWCDYKDMGDIVSETDIVRSKKNLRLYADCSLCSYTIKFDANRSGGTGTGTVNDIAIKYGDEVRMPRNTYTCTIPERPYSSPNNVTIPQAFVGWCTDKNGNGAMFAEGLNIDSNLLMGSKAPSDGSVITLYAIWRPLRPTTTDGGYTYTLTSWILPNTVQEIVFDFGDVYIGLYSGYRISIEGSSNLHTNRQNGDHIFPYATPSEQDANKVKISYIANSSNAAPEKYTITLTSDQGETLDGHTSAVWVSDRGLLPDGSTVVEVYICKDDLNRFLNANEWADALVTADHSNEEFVETLLDRLNTLKDMGAETALDFIPHLALVDYAIQTIKDINNAIHHDKFIYSPHDAVKWLTQKVETDKLTKPTNREEEVDDVMVKFPYWSVDYGVHFTFIMDSNLDYSKISPRRNDYLEEWDGKTIALRPGACGHFITGREAGVEIQYFEQMLMRLGNMSVMGVKENDAPCGRSYLFDLNTLSNSYND